MGGGGACRSAGAVGRRGIAGAGRARGAPPGRARGRAPAACPASRPTAARRSRTMNESFTGRSCSNRKIALTCSPHVELLRGEPAAERHDAERAELPAPDQHRERLGIEPRVGALAEERHSASPGRDDARHVRHASRSPARRDCDHRAERLPAVPGQQPGDPRDRAARSGPRGRACGCGAPGRSG